MAEHKLAWLLALTLSSQCPAQIYSILKCISQVYFQVYFSNIQHFWFFSSPLIITTRIVFGFICRKVYASLLNIMNAELAVTISRVFMKSPLN